jgi:hypothetical protein
MIIVAQGNTIINSDFVTKIYIGGSYDAKNIRADYSGGSSDIARYSQKKISEYVLKAIAIAWADDDDIFYIPDERDVIERMSLHKEERTHVKTKQNRHGGS